MMLQVGDIVRLTGGYALGRVAGFGRDAGRAKVVWDRSNGSYLTYNADHLTVVEPAPKPFAKQREAAYTTPPSSTFSLAREEAEKLAAEMAKRPNGVDPILHSAKDAYETGHNVLNYILYAPWERADLKDMESAAMFLQWQINRLKTEVKLED